MTELTPQSCGGNQMKCVQRAVSKGQGWNNCSSDYMINGGRRMSIKIGFITLNISY